MKTVTKFICAECGAESPKWFGRCPQCGAWDSLARQSLAKAPLSSAADLPQPVSLTEITAASGPRRSSGSSEVDRVLGGGIVPGSLILLGGDPGIGKSTLALQIAGSVGGGSASSVLYVSGEESLEQIKLRAARLSLPHPAAVLAETGLGTILGVAEREKPSLLIIDSIQTMHDDLLPNAPGSVVQVTNAASAFQRFAKQHHVAVLLVGHVTKEGQIAGPKILEHLVDVVLYFEGERFGEARLLRAHKNRFGKTPEVAIFEMADSGLKELTNPSELFIAERTTASGSIIFPSLEGSRPILLELQALTSPTTFGYPKRTVSGLDLNRLNLILAVMTRRLHLNLLAQDVYANVAGGVEVREPSVDLPLALAIFSAFKDKPLDPLLAAVGEIGLGGEIRPVKGIDQRVAEAVKLGFKTIVAPDQKTAAPSNVKLIAVKTLFEAIKAVEK